MVVPAVHYKRKAALSESLCHGEIEQEREVWTDYSTWMKHNVMQRGST